MLSNTFTTCYRIGVLNWGISSPSKDEKQFFFRRIEWDVLRSKNQHSSQKTKSRYNRTCESLDWFKRSLFSTSWCEILIVLTNGSTSETHLAMRGSSHPFYPSFRPHDSQISVVSLIFRYLINNKDSQVKMKMAEMFFHFRCKAQSWFWPRFNCCRHAKYGEATLSSWADDLSSSSFSRIHSSFPDMPGPWKRYMPHSYCWINIRRMPSSKRGVQTR